MTLAQLRTLLPVPLGLAALHAPEALLHRDGGLALALVELRNTVRRRGVAHADDAAHGHLLVGILPLAEHGRHCLGLPKLWYSCRYHSTIFNFFGDREPEPARNALGLARDEAIL